MMSSYERPEMTDDQKEALNAKLNTLSDWRAFCDRCGQKIVGTPEQILGHACGEDDGPD